MCFAKCTGLVSAAPLLSALTLRSEARVTEGERLVHGQEQHGETQTRAKSADGKSEGHSG